MTPWQYKPDFELIWKTVGSHEFTRAEIGVKNTMWLLKLENRTQNITRIERARGVKALTWKLTEKGIRYCMREFGPSPVEKAVQA